MTDRTTLIRKANILPMLRVLKLQYLYRLLPLWVILLFNSQILIWTVHNPYGIKGLGEIYYVILILSAIFMFLMPSLKRSKAPRLDTLIFVLPLIMILVSAFNAFVVYGQPLYAGIIEERRTLSLYVYFPLMYLYKERKYSTEELHAIIVWIGIFSVLLGISYQTNLLPVINEVQIDRLRESRATIGVSSAVLALIVVFATTQFSRVDRRVGLFTIGLIFVSSLLFISQSRGVLIAGLLSCFLVSQSYSKGLKRWALLTASVFVSLMTLGPIIQNSETALKLYELYSEIFSEDYIYTSVRANSIITVYENLSFLGNGALWLQWNNGFARLYGDNFFLTDVGIFGSFFKFGIWGIFLVLIFMRFFYKALTLKSTKTSVLVIKSIFLFLFFMWPIAAIFEYRGHLLGIALTLLTISKMENENAS